MNEQAAKLLDKTCYSVDDLVEIMAVLRSEGGCPWDIEQTHESIRNNFIEEVYEAVEAIDAKSVPMLREELGDVLMQVVFHSRISEEMSEFTFDDVADEVCRKLVVRHPHVFGVSAANENAVSEIKDGIAVAETADAVVTNWDAIKKSIKEQKTLGEELSGVSRALPSLMRAAKLAGKAMKAGAYAPGDEIGDDLSDIDAGDAEALSEIIGARLFELAAAAKKHGVDPEQALYNACDKFISEMQGTNA
jgi:MazG family protein